MMTAHCEVKAITRIAKCSRSIGAVVAGIVLQLVLVTPSAFADFVDGFEGPSIDPFWSSFTDNGSITLTSTIAHSGGQSAQFSSFNTSSNKYEYLFHDFATPQFGTASVWIFDTGAGVSSSNYIGFQIGNASQNFNAGLTTYDYGFAGGGPGRGDQYDYFVSPPGFVAATGIARTQAWHEYKIVDTPSALTISVDGISVYSTAGGTPITQILLFSQAPGFRPAFDQYYDDFRFEALTGAVPEPSTVALLGFGSLILLRCASKRRQG